jgi:hypothetical protein
MALLGHEPVDISDVVAVSVQIKEYHTMTTAS